MLSPAKPAIEFKKYVPPAGVSGILCAGPGFHHVLTKRSPDKMANCVLASAHSQGGIFHSWATWRKTEKMSFVAASSPGKWPRARTARRGLAFKASIALVTGMRGAGADLPAEGERPCGVWCDHPGQRRREHESVGRPITPSG